MAINTGISWTDHTVNFWTGCIKVSEECKYCYMYRDQERWGKEPTEILQVKQSTINSHLKNAKPGDKIFTCSFSDFFIEQADEWRSWAWDIIRSRPDLTWQILTKRPERIQDCLPEDWGDGLKWYNWKEDMKKVSKSFKDYIIDIHRAGSEFYYDKRQEKFLVDAEHVIFCNGSIDEQEPEILICRAQP